MKNKGITLIALVITIIVLVIISSITIYLSLGNNGIFTKAKEAREANNKQEATEKINLKITTAQMNKYTAEQRMPTLKELSEVLKEDEEILYVTEKSQIASKKYEVGENPSSIYTKLNNYPYEFEINSYLQLASINGEKTIDNKLNLDFLENFEQIYKSPTAVRGNYNYKLEKDYSLILIVVYGIGWNGGSENAAANINNNDVIKVLDNGRAIYNSGNQATSVSVGYLVNAKAETVIETNFGYYGATYIYALGE